MTMSLSRDGRLLILNVSFRSPEIHLYSVGSFDLINRYYGHKQKDFVIHCDIGSENNTLIACGSEDGKILIWHRSSSKPIATLTAVARRSRISQSTSINAVAFHPTVPNFLVSADDNKSVRVWGTEQIGSRRSLTTIELVKGVFGRIFSTFMRESQGADERLMDEEEDDDDINDFEGTLSNSEWEQGAGSASGDREGLLYWYYDN